MARPLQPDPLMTQDKKEPQSYGSGPGWVAGRTGGAVNDPAGTPEPEHAEFYDSRHDSEPVEVEPATPVVGHDESVAHFTFANESSTSARKVSAESQGAKRDGFFKKRDY